MKAKIIGKQILSFLTDVENQEKLQIIIYLCCNEGVATPEQIISETKVPTALVKRYLIILSREGYLAYDDNREWLHRNIILIGKGSDIAIKFRQIFGNNKIDSV